MKKNVDLESLQKVVDSFKRHEAEEIEKMLAEEPFLPHPWMPLNSICFVGKMRMAHPETIYILFEQWIRRNDFVLVPVQKVLAGWGEFGAMARMIKVSIEAENDKQFRALGRAINRRMEYLESCLVGQQLLLESSHKIKGAKA